MAGARLSTRLLEREQELVLLGRAWRDAQAGRGFTWLICAEAGGGKTRLLREMSRSGRTLWGNADPVAPPDPYLALIRAIPGFAPAPTRVESAVSAVALLEQAAGGGPLLVVLDDLHFADENTVAVLVYLAAACATRPWLLLAGLRPDEGSATLHAATTELVSREEAHRLDLAPLSHDAIGVLVQDARGRPPSPEEVERIHRESGGNPWFVTALAQGAGAMAAARDRILLRLDRLETSVPGARPLLAALAPAGQPLPHPVVAALGGGDGPVLRGMLRRLRDAGVLQEAGHGAWQFRHELLRRSLLDDMLEVERRDAHRALAEAIERWSAGAPTTEVRQPTAVQIAMHYAEAADPRAVPWALSAAREAARVDAHHEALAQIERALGFEMEPAVLRSTLEFAAIETLLLGQYVESERFAEAALAISDGTPEERSRLYQRAADAARLHGDFARASAHLEEAERLLDGRPFSYEMGTLWTAQLQLATHLLRPARAATAALRALEAARRLEDRVKGARIEARVHSLLVTVRTDSANPEAFALLDLIERSEALSAAERVGAQIRAYSGAIFSLFQERGESLYKRIMDALQRHELGWWLDVQVLRVLELVQRGRYTEARTLATSLAPVPGTLLHSDLTFATALREVRAGSPERAREALAPLDDAGAFTVRAFGDLIRLELAVLEEDPGHGALAEQVYREAVPRRYARAAGVAAVALARAGRGAPPAPDWLAPASPIRLFWAWAAGITQDNTKLLRGVAARLAAMECPYEAALALRDAGDLTAAYRAFRDLGAMPAREQTAAMLRAAGLPIPRRPRVATGADGLTETERAICRLVASGAANEAIAAELRIGLRTVVAHLSNVYQKTGCRGRAALAAWWTKHEHAAA